jgi:lipoate-protein ligase A
MFFRNNNTISVGYFQRLKKEIDIDKVNEKGFGLVRRQTGGRGVPTDNVAGFQV